MSRVKEDLKIMEVENCKPKGKNLKESVNIPALIVFIPMQIGH